LQKSLKAAQQANHLRPGRDPLSVARECINFIAHTSFPSRFNSDHFDILLLASELAVTLGLPLSEIFELPEAILSVRQFNLAALNANDPSKAVALLRYTSSYVQAAQITFQELALRLESGQFDLLAISEEASQLFASVKLSVLLSNEAQDDTISQFWSQLWPSCAMFLEATFQCPAVRFPSNHTVQKLKSDHRLFRASFGPASPI
jgi:hypothetical protein